ncbi:DUF1488 domain-containing protein [Bosea caraganae]|uniref:DUF1488 domain-containing protein n=1 Tax=Bosea caraganae TaxID=2763117 RepID=A0A370KYF2_9HYPH|nr:DUF1488 domain-containing protein [Bosea caraganae]RDJ20023.1 DUF1488 domain-containing protein [Bosea caraganae]RDJ25630.1 DUF1488 domain-containing protein [Bosea caraganae]
MGLNFPNPVRRFDLGRSCVSFWGSDASMEITFQIDFEALRKLSPDTGDVEADVLGVFDANREKIQNAARIAYSRHRTGYHRLTGASF